jgi:hypothetical protein
MKPYFNPKAVLYATPIYLVLGDRDAAHQRLKGAIERTLEQVILNILCDFRPLTWSEKVRPRWNLIDWLEDLFDIDGGRFCLKPDLLARLRQETGFDFPAPTKLKT